MRAQVEFTLLVFWAMLLASQVAKIWSEILELFSKERALYLVDNPTKVGFSWWFLMAGVCAGAILYRIYGDSYFVIMVVEKYAFALVTLSLGLLRKLIEKLVNKGQISRDSALLYAVLPAGYAFTFLFTLLLSHFSLTVFIP